MESHIAKTLAIKIEGSLLTGLRRETEVPKIRHFDMELVPRGRSNKHDRWVAGNTAAGV